MRRRHVLAVVTGAIVLTGCAAGTSDYRRESEKYLESKDLAKEAGYQFSQAVCEQPSTDTKGTQFSCSAVDNDGDKWEFIVEITGDREITVVDGKVVG